MTILTEKPKKAIEINKPCRGIERILDARNTDLGGFDVRRVLPSSHQPMVGPWIFFDHFGPNKFEKGTGVDIRPHPHINMATVTYLFEGEILHQDSTNVQQVIRPGALNLMFAGKGIVHSERTPSHIRQSTHFVHGLQLWLALPEEDEESEPHFYHYEDKEIPHFTSGEVEGRLLIGSAYGESSPVKAFSPTLYLEARMPKGSHLLLPRDPKEVGIYIVKGKLRSQDTVFSESSMAVSTHHDGIEVEALEETQVVVIGGDPVGLRHIWWNFVSSNPERIRQAALDWQDRKFPDIPSDHEDYIQLPE